MSRKSRANPRMLSNVLQAVADLKDAKGSTAKRILEQVQTAINISNLKPKPRNIVTQVRKALRHAVETGILKMKAGKYKLALGQGNYSTSTKKGKTNHRTRSHKKKRVEGEDDEKSDRRCRKPDRRKKERLQRRRRKPCKKRSHSDSPTSTNTRCSTRYDSSSICTYFDSDEEYIRPKRSGNKRSHKKNVRIRQPKRRRGRKRKRTVKRQSTPIPMLPDKSIGELDDDTPSFNSKKSINLFQDDYVPQSLPDFPQDSCMEPLEMRPECDNPNCLCNLKQEPFDDGRYDDTNGSQYM